MVNAPKILGTDKLRQAYPKMNQAIDNANEAKTLAEEALSNSEQTQKELTQAILDGDSSPLGGQLSVGSDGSLYNGPQERLIAEYSKTTQLISEIESDENQYILYSFFKSNADYSTSLFISSDGENIKKINTSNLNLANLRDPSICYFKGWFLVAYTSYNPHDFKISKSKDLINWTNHDISLGLWQNTDSKIWAPEFFVDDDRLYILLSSREGADVVDINGNTIPNFRPNITECTDVENLTFTVPVKLILENANKIDPCAIKHNGEYYIFIKDEYDKNIEAWKSSSLTGVYSKINDAITGLANTEGPSVISYKGLFYLYGDSFANDIGITYFVTSSDLINWSSRKQLKTKERLRHGAAFTLSNSKGIQVLRKFINGNFVKEKNTKEKGLTLSSFATNNVVSSLELLDEMIYSVSGNEKITIAAFTNPFNAKRFYFYIASNSDASIEILNGSGIVSIPSNTKWDASYGDGDTLIEFVWVEAIGSFKPVNPNFKKFYDKRYLQPKLGWKRVNLVDIGLNQSALPVEEGVIYALTGTSNATISGVTSLPDGARFGVAVFAGSATLTITSGTNITVPGGTFIIGASNNNNETVIEFVKVPSSTFRLIK